MARHRTPMPPYALAFIEEVNRRSCTSIIVGFHRWLLDTGTDLRAVQAPEVEAFVASRNVAQLTRNSYRWDVKQYLFWLAERGLAGPFEKKHFEAYHRRPLPEDVAEFLRYLAPTRKPATVRNYLTTLRRFHEWLGREGIAPADVTREVCLRWSQKLHADGLHPGTHVGELVCVRRFYDWQWELGRVPIPGRELILGSDMPKKPNYLPRPLSAEADDELQGRLKDSDSTLGLGLYVMRRTGLRIGELRRLKKDCVRVDHNGGHFLKVPLGKMNSERLVPLDPKTLEAVSELQSKAREADWLIAGARDRPVAIATYQRELSRLADGMRFSEPLTTHRLRHSFATSLMNGGMSLMGIQKLLGHKDLRMTLRYTQIADEVVGREYFQALARVGERYASLAETGTVLTSDPVVLLHDAIRWVAKHLCLGPTERHARLLIRRLEAARDELAVLRELAVRST